MEECRHWQLVHLRVKITQTFFLLRTAFWLLVYRWLNFKVLLLYTDDALLAQNLLIVFVQLQAYRLATSNDIY